MVRPPLGLASALAVFSLWFGCTEASSTATPEGNVTGEHGDGGGPSEEQPPTAAVDDPGAGLERGFKSIVIASGFQRASAFTFAPNGLILVAEQRGTVRVVQDGKLVAEPFIDLQADVNMLVDRGLLGIAVHPDFPARPYVYLLHTYDPPETAQGVAGAAPDGGGARVSRLVRVEADPAFGYTRALPNSLVVLLGKNSTYAQIGDPAARNDYERPTCGARGAYVRDCVPADEHSHTIGMLAFGPDGLLYAASGDACDVRFAEPTCTRALDVDSLAGKILRLDPITGEGVANNPFADGDLGSNRSKVYQLGLRNPFRFAIDRATGGLYVGDVGWNTWEEVNHAPAGANFGWPCYEGANGHSLPQPSYQQLAACAEFAAGGAPVTAPWYAYVHEQRPEGGGSAVLVGDFYSGTSYPPLYRGALFYADFDRRELRYLTRGADGTVAGSQVFTEGIGYLTQVSADPVSGDFYMLQLGGSGGAGDSRLERLVFQGYDLGPSRDDYYVVRNAAGTSCLDARAAQDGAFTVEAQPCNGGESQRWWIEGAGTDRSRFRSTSGASLAVADAQGDVAEVGSSTVAGEAASFQAYRIGDALQLISVTTRLCLNMPEQAGARVNAARCAHGPAQLFEIASAGNRRPSVNPVMAQTATVGQTVRLQLAASDSEGNALTFSAQGLPTSLSLDTRLGVISGEPTRAGNYRVRVRVTDGELEASTAFTWQVLDHKQPEVVIARPLDATPQLLGTTVEFAGSARDHMGRDLAPEQLRWELYTRHNEHEHYGGLTVNGASGSFALEDHGDNTSYELCLTATDDEGRSGRVCKAQHTVTVAYELDTVPSGLSLPWEGVYRKTPFTVQTSVGGMRDLIAPPRQGELAFSSWSDGGPAIHQVVIGAQPQRLVATYTPE